MMGVEREKEREKKRKEETKQSLDQMLHRFFPSLLFDTHFSRPSPPNPSQPLDNSPARLPGGPLSSASSANLGWHALTGALDEFDVGSYLGPGAGVPGQESEEMPADLHSQAEALFKLGTKPARRAT
jgi:hypothetical protein